MVGKKYTNYSYYKMINFEDRVFDINTSKLKKHPIHFHDCLEIVMVMEGSISVKTSAFETVVQKNQFIVINTFEIHALKALAQETKIIYMHIKPDSDPAEEDLFMLDINVLYRDKEKYLDIQKCLVDIFVEAYYSKQNEQKRIRELLTELMNIMNSNMKYVMYEVEGSNNEYINKDLYIERLNEIINYLYLHYDEYLTLDGLAKEFNISKFHLSHIIKKAFNRSFVDMLKLIRTDRAEMFIMEGEMSMNEICDLVGFSSYQLFSKAFKKDFGFTPMQYQKKFKCETIKYKTIDEEPFLPAYEQLQQLKGHREDNSKYGENPLIIVPLDPAQYSITEIQETEDAVDGNIFRKHTIENYGKIVIDFERDELIIKIKRKKDK